MKTVWEIQEDDGNVVGSIIIEGDWRIERFRETFIGIVMKMHLSVYDSLSETKIEGEEE